MTDTIQSQFRKHYQSVADVVVSAPGRVEFIGNHTDYNGGCVVGAAIDRRLWVALSKRKDKRLRLVSEGGYDPVVTSLSTLDTDRLPPWTLYPLGVVQALIRHIGCEPDHGFDLSIVSDLPTGAGLSSSAALEMSTALALSTLWDLSLDMNHLVRIALQAETEFVGMPCGILDQTVVGFGRKNHLVHIDAFDESHRMLPVPGGTSVWIFQTHRSHRLSTSPYAERRKECETAVDILSSGRDRQIPLAHYSLVELTAAADQLPARARLRAEHVINEQRRVKQFSSLVSDDSRLAEAGQLLFESHASSRSLFENSTSELDFLVDTLSHVSGVIGARLTGGGFGGAVLAWTTDAFGPSQRDEVATAYEDRFDAVSPAWKTAISDGVRLEETR